MNDLTQARKLIKECKEAQNPYLDLGRCGITDLNELPELFECKHIETLILSDLWSDGEEEYTSNNNEQGNIISFIPKEISKLKKIKKLICSNDGNSWGISDIHFLENLTRLQYLDLRNNIISDIRVLEKLTKLQNLNLRSNQISDIRALGKLTKLQKLYLSHNQISDIRVLEKLTGLQKLYLGDNQISDIRVLEKLIKLQDLSLRYNSLKEIPKFIFQLKMEINMNEYGHGGLCLNANPIESPPLEIIIQGKQSVLRWFEAKEREELKKLNEIKIILIGEPKAGKTSLLKRLKDNSFNENEEQTDGVNIEDIEFGKCDTFKEQKPLHDIIGHFWDFGGQEIINATHQFFLTKRSIYVLVLDARKDANNAAQIRDWVKRVRATGGDSPIIILANQIDVNPGFGFVNERELQEEFPQIKYFEKISCKDNKNIDLFKNKLAELIPTAELFQTEIDERWISVKNKLQEETRREYYLNQSRFIEICNEFNLNEKPEQKNAVTFLHDLGLVLHFEDLNSDYYVLNPYWITYGAYQILTSKFAGENKGEVAKNKLEFIVNEEEDKKETYKPADYKKIKYSPNEIRFLTDILHEFKLCFWTTDRNYFIIPDILDTTEPLEITEPIRSSGECIRFVYDYDYLPKSVMPNIMVETHHIIEKMWRTGCVLLNNDCEALITSYGNRISITVSGEYKKKRECMSVIWFIVGSINQKLSNKPVELIPLPEVNDVVKYKTLLAMEKEGKIDYTYYECEPPKSFHIKKLLDGIREVKDNDSQLMREMFDCVRSIKKDTEGIKNKLDLYFNELVVLSGINKDEIQKAIKELNEQQTDEIIGEIMTWITTAFGLFNDEMGDKLTEFHNKLKQTDDVKMKLKLSIPFIKLLGINFETEFDVKSWAKKMYKKYEVNMFKLMGAL